MSSSVIAPVRGRKSLNNTFRYGGGTGTILIDGSETGGAFALLDAVQMPGAEPPLHVHEREDETFFVLEGSIAFWVGGQVHRLEAGEAIFLPRAVPHTFRIKSAVARGLNYISPAGFEEWFRTLGTPATSFDLPATVEPMSEELEHKAMELGPKLGVRVLGPAPEF
jgi:quercetin dioxygenase-like cupin family protein